MKRLLLIVLLLLLIVGCSQKPVDETTLIEKDGLMYLWDSDSPYSGEVVGLYKTGEEMYDGVYEDGVLVGDYTYYKKDGSVNEPINIETTLVERDGIFYTKDTNKPYSGPVFSLYEDGKKKDEGTLKDGKMISKTEWEWYSNGQKEVEKTYKDGKKDGLWTEWYENGQKAKEETYKDGFRHGDWTYYTEVGNSKYNVTYKVGTYNLVVFTDNLGTNYTGLPVTDEPEQDGTYLLRRDEYDFSKTPVAFGTIKDGKKDGLYIFWHDNGQKRREGTYKDGKFDGEWTYWYEDGKKKDEGTYKDGKNHGLWTTWYVNGQKRYEETYKDGEITDYKILDVDKEFELAETFRIQNNFKEAISILNRLVKIKSEVSPKAQYLIAEIYYRDMQDFTTAIKQYGDLRIQFSDSKQVPFSLFMQGFIYANMLADFEKAKEYYTEFLEKYPNHELYQSVGFELKYLGRDINEIPELKHLTQ